MKRSLYMNVIEKENYLILHNPLHNSLIKVTDPLLKEITLFIKGKIGNFDLSFNTDKEKDYYNALIEQKMIIDDSVDEINVLNYNYREWLVNASKKIQIIMIPTRNCNFRCPYCYELHEKIFMEEDTYQEVFNLIKNYVEIRNCSQVEISWFGGEPMLVYDKIILFMNKIKSALPNVDVCGRMTTNGYLLTKERMQKLIHSGVNHYQITVDGMGDTHDKTRYLAGGHGTWATIIGNLLDFRRLKEQFSILIRTNMSRELVRDPYEWFQFLKANFSEDPRFTFHCETIKDLGGENKEYAYTSNPVKDDPMMFILELYKKYELPITNYTNYLKPFSAMCYAANPYSWVIDYDGKVEKCTVCIDDEKNKVGEVKNNNLEIDKNAFAWWSDYETYKECKECKIFPICYGKKCPNSYYNPNTCFNLLNLYESIIKTAY